LANCKVIAKMEPDASELVCCKEDLCTAPPGAPIAAEAKEILCYGGSSSAPESITPYGFPRAEDSVCGSYKLGNVTYYFGGYNLANCKVIAKMEPDASELVCCKEDLCTAPPGAPSSLPPSFGKTTSPAPSKEFELNGAVVATASHSGLSALVAIAAAMAVFGMLPLLIVRARRGSRLMVHQDAEGAVPVLQDEEAL